jgi:signal transduction histidine kinase
MHLSFRGRGLLLGSVIGAALSGLFLLFSFILPRVLTSNYYQNSLQILRGRAESIKREFAILEWRLQRRIGLLISSPFPRETEAIFELFQKSGLNPEVEGAAYYREDGELAVWLGNVIDFRPAFPGASMIVRSKASIYLLASQRIRDTEIVLVTRLLAFRPQLRAPYLEEYQFLSPELRQDCQVDYWDYREDVSGFESFFARHKDEYIGQPRLQSVIQQLFFPLRNDRKEIIATITYSSPSLISIQSRQRDRFLLLSILLLIVSLILLAVDLAKTFFTAQKNRFLAAALLFLALTGLRLVFFPLSRMEKLRDFPLFSPSLAGFFSWGDLTRSPADIFLTSLLLSLIIGGLALALSDSLKPGRRARRPLLAWTVSFLLLAVSIASLSVFRTFLSRLISNSNVHLLHFSADVPFLILHLSAAALLFSLLLFAYSAFRAVHLLLPAARDSAAVFILSASVFLLLVSRVTSTPLFIFQLLLLAFLFLLGRRTHLWKKAEFVLAGLMAAALFVYLQVHLDSSARLRSLVQDSLRHTITAQENWADFLLRQSIAEIEKRSPAILSFLRNPDESQFARLLWENTLVAKLNWYSTLEVIDPEGGILSRFSLNIPQLYQPELELPYSQTWEISRLAVPSLGKEREFILGYKDWFLNEEYLGRLTFYLTLDPEILPFLYSANPYFELLKVSSPASLSQLGIGLAIYDARGRLVFNPARISSGLSTELSDNIAAAPEGIWSSFSDRGQKQDAFYFRRHGRVYSLFIPHKSVTTAAVEFIKLLILYLAVAAFFFLLLPSLLGKKRLANIFWSFSSRVYTAFIAITMISLALFSLFSHRFFHRMFTQRFIEKAEIHANFARNIMQDFVTLQQEEGTTLIAPTDDFVLWISSAIANDVNLYREGRLMTSSRREFFDWGLLSELVDGEIYYRITHDNKPFYTQRQKIGTYSFQSLTIPYTIGLSQFLISLPFPFEEQEISGAAEELVEFLTFVSIFFIGIVLAFARGMGRMIISPVEKLLAGTREVSLGNLEITIAHRSHDEMKTLVDGFNAMVENLKKHQREIAELSKKAAWAEMAQKVAHEIKNPLTPIQLSAEHILRVYEDNKGGFDKALRESASYIISEVENLRRIAQEFLELSRETALKKERFDLRDLIREVAAPYQKMLSERVRLREVYEGSDFRLEADRSKIKIALRNIVINAIEAIRGRGEIEIRASRGQDSVRLEIRDTGAGIPNEVLKKIFDPYFSTKDVGTGLGLPIAKKIVEDHGGSIRAESEVGKGTAIFITLPAGPAAGDPGGGAEDEGGAP